MKKIIYILGAIFLSIIIILNIAVTSKMNFFEYINIEFNNILYIVGIDILVFLIYIITKFIHQHLYKRDDKKEKMIRRIILAIAIIIYIAFSGIWTATVECIVEGDQIPVLETATALYHGNVEEVLAHDTYAGVSIGRYLETNQQQIPLACMYSLFLKIMHTDQAEMLRIVNIISNIFIILALYKITSQLAKSYSVNKVLMFTLVLTFISIPMLSTFIYGDIPSLALCLFAIYFIMKYREKRKIRYMIGAAFLNMMACMMRMNSLIFVIATVMYLIFALLENMNKKLWKEKILSIVMILVYLVVCLFPSSLVKSYFLEKYHLDKEKGFSSSNYLLMAMVGSRRSNGWYNEEIGEYTLKNPEAAKEEHKVQLKERMNYFLHNPGQAIGFYVVKLASTWTENTYSAVRNNMKEYEDPLQEIAKPVTFYQKALLMVICLCSFVVLIQNRKDLSLEVLFLVTIFIGGFVFHILWETKSRYVIPYIIVLIPIASISIQGFKRKQIN